jgi:murein DD-endopeptidase MepM/ murein hydrolase activator NlpD
VSVNKKLRKENEDKITATYAQGFAGDPVERRVRAAQQFQGRGEFRRPPHVPVQRRAIDTAYHLGYDLSVTKRYPVEAANSGTVVFAADLGIYGTTVILDHGIGLFTLYGPSQPDRRQSWGSRAAAAAPRPNRGDGLAAGDHLHYGVYLHGVAILPVEWWDPKWIDDNITPKLAGMTGEAIHETQQPSRASRTGKRRR